MEKKLCSSLLSCMQGRFMDDLIKQQNLNVFFVGLLDFATSLEGLNGGPYTCKFNPSLNVPLLIEGKM
jgi:hypothetical protein